MAEGSGGAPKLDGRNYVYWKARMAGYLEAINPIAWAVKSNMVLERRMLRQEKYQVLKEKTK